VSGTALDHRLVRGYLSELDAAMRGLPAAQARELKEQITAHLDDALGPDAGDQEVAAILSRLGSPAGTFAAAVGNTRLQATATSLAALLRVEDDQSVQRAILYAALIARPPVLRSGDLSVLQQAATDERSDLTAFNSAASPATQQLYANTVSGATVDVTGSAEILAEQTAAASPSAPLTGNAGLDAGRWYRGMSTTIGDTRKVTGQLAAQVSAQADTLKSNATRNLLLTSTATLILLLVLLISAALARPLRK
jgi:nitrate/nitrite sensing protein/HAAS domain-containing protein